MYFLLFQKISEQNRGLNGFAPAKERQKADTGGTKASWI
jgi:hypothetical protein